MSDAVAGMNDMREADLTDVHGRVSTGGAVLLVDHPWPDVDIEKAIIGAAGYRLECGPMEAPDAADIERHVRAVDPVAILTCWGQVSPAAIAAPTDLRVVARLGVGLDNIAVSEATSRGAWVTNVPDYCVSNASIAELRRRACEDVVRVLRGETPRHRCNIPLLGEPLPGGVASDIRVVRTKDGDQVVKRALSKLRVEADWFSDPRRSGTEVAAIAAFAEFMGPGAVPRVLWNDPAANTFAMARVDQRLRNWKSDLLAGRVDLATARRAGVLLGRLHRGSSGRHDLKERFGDLTYFKQLRVEPFFNRVAARLPDVGSAIGRVVQSMADNRSALVHGDYSPKNILADGADVVVLDFEVAHWGDPRFDVGFCVSHLMLKALRRQADEGALLRAAEAFLESYAMEGPPIDDADLVRLTGALVLARFEGSSPVDYLADVQAERAREMAANMLLRPKGRLSAQISRAARGPT